MKAVVARLAAQLTVLLVLLLLGGVHARSAHPPPVRRLHHPSSSSVRILPRLTSPHAKRSRISPHPTTLRHDDTLFLTLSVSSLFSYPIDLFLRPTEHFIHPSAKITYGDGQSHRLVRDEMRVYTGDVLRHASAERVWAEEVAGVAGVSGRQAVGSARVMIHNVTDAVTWEGVFEINGVHYNVLTSDHYQRVKSTHDAPVTSDEGSLVVFADTDMWHDSDTHLSAATCSHDTLAFNVDASHPIRTVGSNLNLFGRDDISGATSSTNYINSINSTSGCPLTQQIVYMGVALDCNYVQSYGSTDAARTQALNNWNMISALYKSTFNISLGIIELVVQNATCGSANGTNAVDPSWNVPCSGNVTLDNRLSSFSQWRGGRSGDGAGIWHLMSACPTETEVGVAWLGTLCQTGSSYQSGAYVSGTAISTATTTEWSLISHEIGHNFGAIHDCTSGCSLSGSCCPYSTSSCDAGQRYIMNPTTSPSEVKFSACTLGNICSGIGTKVLSTSCIQTPGNEEVISLQQCGNGILEAGEECDPGSNATSTCCDTTTCKFTSGSVCDPANSACCTSSCQLSAAGTVCRPAVNTICDIAEVCTGSNATCPPDMTTADGTSCGSNGLACAAGVCTSLDLQCQTAGAGMNLTTACGQRDDKSCVVTCKDPTTANQCVVLQTLLVDGSPCGYGGHCYNGTCDAGSLNSEVSAWYSQNLQIAIPVTIIGALGVIVILIVIARTIFGCVKRKKMRQNAKPIPPPVDARSRPTSMAQGPGRPMSQVPPPPGAYGGPASRSTVADPTGYAGPVGGGGGAGRYASAYGEPGSEGGYNGDPRYSQHYGQGGYDQAGQDGGMRGYDGERYFPRYEAGYGQHPQHPQAGQGGQGGQGMVQGPNGWVDETLYNGPNYGLREAYGR